MSASTVIDEGDLDGAEYHFKRLLHYLPEHAAARFMLGLIYVRKGHRDDGITLMELALERCPWNRHWRSDLARAYRMIGRDPKAAALARGPDDQTAPGSEARRAVPDPPRLPAVRGIHMRKFRGPRLLASAADQLPALRYCCGRRPARRLAGDAAQSSGRRRPGGASGCETPRRRRCPQPTLPDTHGAGGTVWGRRPLGGRRGPFATLHSARPPADLGVRPHRQQHCCRECRSEHASAPTSCGYAGNCSKTRQPRMRRCAAASSTSTSHGRTSLSTRSCSRRSSVEWRVSSPRAPTRALPPHDSPTPGLSSSARSANGKAPATTWSGFTQVAVNTDEPVPADLLELRDSTDLIERAIDQSAEIAVKRRQLGQAELEVDQARTASMPTIYLQADRYYDQPGLNDDSQASVVFEASLDGLGLAAKGRTAEAAARSTSQRRRTSPSPKSN